MQTNILEYLENTVKRVPEKTAFADENQQLSFEGLEDTAKRIGTAIASERIYKKPVIVFMKKSPALLAAFFGVVYGGCFYVPIDEEMPESRIGLIIQSTKAEYLICDNTTIEKVQNLNFSGIIVLYEKCIEHNIDDVKLDKIRKDSLDIDPVYVFYTSGSTGVPKGVTGCHRGIIDYIEHLSEALQFDEDCVFANQTPMYWDASMKEIYATLKHGATTYIVPKNLFMLPVKLIEYLNRYRINTICWVVSALTMISAYKTFDIIKPKYLRLVAFCGEVFPVKQFNIWKRELPKVEFYNLYGPTETTGVSTFYHADRIFADDEIIPIGKAFPNTQIILLNEDMREVRENETGEICIRGSCVTMGYYGDFEKTNIAFVQNPTSPEYRDIIYRTGDIARKDKDGNLIFIDRKDNQIKHMGHRIELGEIEADVLAVDGVNICCCIYVKENNKIVLFYTGDIEKGKLTKELKKKLPRYMLPNAMIKMDTIPVTQNGKRDRRKLYSSYMMNMENTI